MLHSQIFKRECWLNIFFFISIVGIFIYATHLTHNSIQTPPFRGEDFNNYFEKIIKNLNYPAGIEKYRLKKMPHMKNGIYLDYTGSGVYPDVLTNLLMLYQRQFVYSKEKIIEQCKNRLLRFFGTSDSQYSVIFTASATGAIKLLGETFPFDNKSKFIYSRSNHNSILGVREYAIAKNASFMAVDTHENFSKTVKSNEFMNSDFFSLFAFPLEDNFAGTKVPEEEMKIMSHLAPEISNWDLSTARVAVLADAAAYIPTNPLNLTKYPFHAICLSFYKIFGIPNIGALIIRNDFANYLSKHRISYSDYSENRYFEDSSFLTNYSINLEDDNPDSTLVTSILLALQFFEKIGMKNIQEHVWQMTRKLYERLENLQHLSGIPLAEIYGNHQDNSSEKQGGIVAFNVKDDEGKYIGYYSVVKEASKAGFNLRGGCHCNPGSCFNSVRLTEDKVFSYYGKKTTCGDTNDIVDGIPLGAVRASIGWATTPKDIDDFIQWIAETYV